MTYPAQQPSQIGLLNRLAMSYAAAIDDVIEDEYPCVTVDQRSSEHAWEVLAGSIGLESAVAAGKRVVVVLVDHGFAISMQVLGNGKQYVSQGAARADLRACAHELFGPSSFEEL